MASDQSTNTQHPEKLTEAAFARLMKTSRQAIHQLVKRGIIEKDKDGLIDVEKAKIALANHVHPSSKTAAALQAQTAEENKSPAQEQASESTEITSYHVAKTLREAEEAKMARIKRMQLEGAVGMVADMEREAYTEARIIRDTLLGALPTKLAPQLAAITDPFALEQALREGLRAALHDVVRQVEDANAPG